MQILADKARKIIAGEINSSDEINEFGLRLDGERGSTYITDNSLSLEEIIDAMTPADRRDTQNIEILLKRYSQNEVLEILSRYDNDGWEVV